MSTVVYKVSGDATSSVYYGYDSSGDMSATFFAGCDRTDSDGRGDSRMLAANNGDKSTLTFEVVSIVEDEFDAWCMRNDLRSADSNSITGPTMLPVGWGTRIKAEQPDRLANWTKQTRLNKFATAREAYEDGAYTFAEISAASKTFGKLRVMDALSSMSPSEFSTNFLTQ